MTRHCSASQHIHGFVVWFDASDENRLESPVTVLVDGVSRAVVGQGFGLYARPRGSGVGIEGPEVFRSESHPRDLAVSWGWIANRVEIANRLGHPELADADDEVLLLAAYRRWGHALCEHLEGEHSWVVLDPARGVVHAARDALGLKRCYYLCQGKRTWIASNLELLFTILGHTPDLDVAALSRTLRHGFFHDDPGTTIYRGVQQLLPGHVATFNGGGPPRQERWWSFQNHDGIRPGSTAARDSDERFRELLTRGVESALPTHGPVLAELSGGRGSSSVVALAAWSLGERHERDRLHTISYIQPSHDIDERPFQRDLYRQYGLANSAFELEEALRPEDLIGQTCLGPHNFQTLRPADRQHLLSLGSHVCLTGQGGDAMLGGFQAVADPPPTGRWRRLWRALSAFADDRGSSLIELLRIAPGRSFSGPPAPPPWLIMESLSIAAEDQAAGTHELLDLPTGHDLYTSLSPHTHDDPRSEIEYRAPLLNRSLVELVLRMPREQPPRSTTGRAIQRRALHDILPSSIRDRQHRGDITVGMEQRFRTLQGARARIRQGRWLADLGILEPKLFTAALDRAFDGLVDRDAHPLLAAATFELWLEANQGLPTFNASSSDLSRSDPMAQWAATSCRLGQPADSPNAMTTTGGRGPTQAQQQSMQLGGV